MDLEGVTTSLLVKTVVSDWVSLAGNSLHSVSTVISFQIYLTDSRMFWCSYGQSGKSSLKPEDAIPDYTKLEPAEMKVLDQWYDFFSKVRSASTSRFNVVIGSVELIRWGDA